ncbi:hypothetical protein ANO11243_083190 [Dothideomycetidae sp. 11243]|nr:hypothetical protein ANO11243_083190 [fungal sp. No.11243]
MGTASAPTGKYFCYRSLMDPSLLIDLPGFHKDAMVEGTVYNVETVKGAQRLAAYETNHHHAKSCLMQSEGSVFIFVSDEDDLGGGVFDLTCVDMAYGKTCGSGAAHG